MEHSLTHGSFTVSRRFDAPVPRVFLAWSCAEDLRLWAAPAEGWMFEIESFDFRINGAARMLFGPKGDVPYVDSSGYDDIVPNRRIVTAYSIAKGEVRISSSVSALEFAADGQGTLLRITEMGVYLDGHDSAAGRKGGVTQQLDQLGRFITSH